MLLLMTLSDVELGARFTRMQSVPERAWDLEPICRRALVAEGEPWGRERAGIDQSQPRRARRRPLLLCSWPSTGSQIMLCFVCWEVTSGLHMIVCRRGPFWHYVPEPQQAQQGGRHLQGRESAPGRAPQGERPRCPGAPGSGEQAAAAAGGFEQAFGLPSQRRWLPISNTGRAQRSEDRGGDGSSESPMILCCARLASCEGCKQRT
jgi:hypothetical protein